MQLFYKIYKYLSIGIVYAVLGYLGYQLFLNIIDFSSIPVTTINIISTLLVIFIGTPLIVAGAMANDSGKGGFIIGTLQFLTLSYPLVYFIGLISSIVLLYSSFEDKEEISRWLASMSVIQLLILVMFFVFILLKGKFDDMQRESY
jgi:hypothetical protein